MGLKVKKFACLAGSVWLAMITAQAQTFDDIPAQPPGEGPAPGPYNEQTFSMGVFRLSVTDVGSAAWLPLLSGYPGYLPVSRALTSPLCFDFNTLLGRSAATTPLNPLLLFGGVQVGHTPGTSMKSSDYSAFPLDWPTPALTTREVLTEVRCLNLATTSQPGCSNVPPGFGVPTTLPAGITVVKAGAICNGLPISRGQVQSYSSSGVAAHDFPATSFFDIFVEVTVPAFGPWPGATLTNADPLIVENTNLTRFPPTVVYIHGQSAAVPVYFSADGPAGTWHAGDLFGTVILAGHGVQFSCSDPANGPNSLLTQTFGPANNNPGAPVALDYFYGTNIVPPAQSTFASVLNAGTNKFSVAGSQIWVRNINHYVLGPGIPLSPVPCLSCPPIIYSSPASQISFELSLDQGQSWNSNSAPASFSITATTITNPFPWAVYRTEMTQLNISGGSLPAGIMIRESPTKQSLGRTTVKAIGGGYRISSFFDVFLEVSADNGTTWNPADSGAVVGLMPPTQYDITLAPGYNFIANNELHTNFNINSVIPLAPNGATFQKWNNAAHTYLSAETYASAGGWSPGTNTFKPGELAALNNPNPSPFIIHWTTTPPYNVVLQDLLPGQIYGYSSQTPSLGTYESITGRLPAQGCMMLKWNTNSQAYDQYNFTGGTWSPSRPTVNIGESVFVQAPPAGTACLGLGCPGDIIAYSTDGGPVNVPYTVGLSNYCGAGPTTLVCNPPSPGPFPVGTNVVVCVATNSSSGTQCSFKVIVLKAPPGNMTIRTLGTSAVVLSWSGSYFLQTKGTLAGPWTDLTPTAISGPYTNPISSNVQFFRLRQ
jgi:hypothetical protein